MAAKKPIRYAFKIPIGDWSDDGHGKCDWFAATAAKPIEAVREAWFKAKELYPTVSPDSWCDAYEDNEIPDDVRLILEQMKAPIELSTLDGDDNYIDVDLMAILVVWFLNLGDPKLDAKLDPESATPMLPFYGCDSKKRHIGYIGYGLFG